MAHLLTPTLEQRASREFLQNSPSGVTIHSWYWWLPCWDYTGYWTGYTSNYVSNTIGAAAGTTGAGAGSGTGATAYRQWNIPAGQYTIHYHIEVKCDTSNAGSSNYWTDDIGTTGSASTDANYYYTGTAMSVNGTIINSVKQKNVQFCSSRSNTSAIESNRAYVTFDHNLEWSHNGGYVYNQGVRPFQAGYGFVSVEDFWFILRRVR
jgi:hypothetical protein